MTSRRIAYAYFDPDWDKSTMPILVLNRTEVEPLDYEAEMRGHLHCPSCYEPLLRVPGDPAVAIMANGANALFRHFPDENAPYCRLRSGIMVGKKYDSEVEAAKAVEDGDLIIISGFKQERPQNNSRQQDEEHAEPVETEFESEDGPPINVPASRHEGQTFNLPSKLTSVQSLCTNFRQNFYRDIHVAVGEHVYHYVLADCLKEAAEIDGEDDVPKFYFGEIVRFLRFDHTSHVFLRHPLLPGNVDFRISARNEDLDARGITQANALRRILLFFGKISSCGAGYWSKDKAWGEIAILPAKYEDFLFANYKTDEE
ncbi:hypothetical protein RC91_12490 [Pectobacterium brasiliense]|uniref:hypothetical protein n=1 Tax=Pectobacterium brasiliense TaxID=180957 RepID=UPI00057ED88A|nr:hypothetical protein [Pectobacterium brasiliense]KHT02774.1 hypothetical protein RC91_12490 [Pectobacterium brasiliense]MDY4323063.1 hypothetical protein [Pectobacterium brasiliense]